MLKGLLTSHIEKKTKDNETYYYGFFKLETHEQETPVIFKKDKPSLSKGTQVELEGHWAKSNGDRLSFTCSSYQLLKAPVKPTLTSLQEALQPLLTLALEKKQEWQQRTDFFFRKKRDLEEIKKVSALGSDYLKAYLLTKQAFYANYQVEHLEQANFDLPSYLERINSELERERQHIQAYLSKEKVNQAFTSLAHNSIQTTLQALENKDQVIKSLEQKLAHCVCQKEVSHA